MQLTVNHRSVEVDPKPGEMLSDLLRERLGLTGTKIGCNEAECGSCTVLVDGDPILSCAYPALRAQSRQVITVEALASQTAPSGNADQAGSGHEKSPIDGGLNPLQQAFITHGAIQCGFCIPGQIMTAYALLQRKPDPTDEDIRQALKDTLCRCGGYPSIISAVKAAAVSIRTGDPVCPSPLASSATALDSVGTVQIRPDALGKVTGAAKFTDDIKFEGMLSARVKRAGVPHAILTKIDIEKACALSGVAAILTAADIPGKNDHGLVVHDWPVLVGAGERARETGLRDP